MEQRDDEVPQLTKARVGALLGVAVGIYLVLLGVGLTLTRMDELAEVRSDELGAARWLEENRTPTWNAVTDVLSSLADTLTIVGAAAVLVVVLRVWLGRWRESLVVVAAVLGEVLIFMAVTASIDRKRPPVPHLDEAPPTSSFPSGHTAAAVALYGTLGVLLLIRLVHRRLALVLALLCFAVPFLVAGSRLYRGMHYPGDVLFGALASACWVAAVFWLLLRPSRAERAPRSSRRTG